MNNQPKSLENQFIYPYPEGKQIYFGCADLASKLGLGSLAPLGVVVNEEPKKQSGAKRRQNQ